MVEVKKMSEEEVNRAKIKAYKAMERCYKRKLKTLDDEEKGYVEVPSDFWDNELKMAKIRHLDAKAKATSRVSLDRFYNNDNFIRELWKPKEKDDE